MSDKTTLFLKKRMVHMIFSIVILKWWGQGTGREGNTGSCSLSVMLGGALWVFSFLEINKNT